MIPYSQYRSVVEIANANKAPSTPATMSKQHSTLSK